DGDFVLMGEAEGREDEGRTATTLHAFRLQDLAEVGTARVPGALSGSVVLGPHGTTFALVADEKKTVYGRFSERGRFVTFRAGDDDLPALSDDGRFLALTRNVSQKDGNSGHGEISIWNTASLRLPASRPTKPSFAIVRPTKVSQAAFSPDGRLLA